MTICEPFYEGLDRRLGLKMSINRIAEEMCQGVKDPRRKVIRILREYKGDKYLIDNADWLGYDYMQAEVGRDVQGNYRTAKNCSTGSTDTVRSKQINNDYCPWLIQDPKYGTFDTRLGVMEDSIEELRDKITGEKGIALRGWLPEDTAGITIRHLCYIDPDITEGYYHIIMMTIINTNPGDEEEAIDDRDIKMKMNHTILPIKSYMVGFQLDLFFYPDWYYNKIKAYLRGESEELPDYQPKFRKSQHPDWKWNTSIRTRINLLVQSTQNPYNKRYE